jgi:glutamine amidotransferase
MASVVARPGVVEAMTVAVIGRGAPVLGIWVGRQLMAARGHEFGVTDGLGWIDGDVRRIEPDDPALKVPHMGWNAPALTRPHPVLAGLDGETAVYFTHSFAMFPKDDTDVAAYVDHGGRFPAAVARDNLVGVQFHPEKSQGPGLRLLADFLEWRP